ncbi:hypothetical protein [Haemophilus haemolyticus]|uniref:hypothetical protein n=1 Tax=Haemophilus haemolyticus TaxID=726 RepID=UPI000E0D6566|nr:hypothetical protein [Haemophilus haemolyticus]
MCKNIGTCRLCDTEKILLKESHIIPKFIYDWIKETSPTPYLRYSDNVNKREQDGIKVYLLCNSCEQRLSSWEDKFSREIFRKIANYRTQSKELNVSKESLLAIISIFWRKLITIDFNKNNNWELADKEYIFKLSEILKKQMLSLVVNTKIYFLPLFREDISGMEIYARYFLERSVDNFDIRFLDDPHRYISLFKLPFMYFYIFNDGWDAISEINNTLELEEGIFNINNIVDAPEVLKKLICDQICFFYDMRREMNDNNLNKIRDDIKNNPNFKTTGAYKSLVK